MQEAGIDLFQRTEGGVRPVPHQTCHLSSKTFRRMKTVQRREQVLFLLIGCSSDCFAGLEETASSFARNVLC
jgi:RNA:NAD 2'-phosphotransferase (TPT1/KptA family)